MKFIELPVRNLQNHRIRSLLTSLGIAIALAGMLALLGLSRGLERSWVVSLESKGTHIVALRKGSIELLSADPDESLTDRIRKVPGVAAVMAGLGDLVELDAGQTAYVAGWPPGSDFWKHLVVKEGRTPTASEPEGVVLGEALARALSKKPGDSIRLSGQDFNIAGISRQPSVLDDRSVMMPMPTMQQLIGREGKVSGFHIRIEHPEIADQLAHVQTRLGAAFPELTFIESGEIGKNAQVTQLLRAIAWSGSHPKLGGLFQPEVTTGLMAEAAGMALLLGLLGGLYPAWRATRLHPLELLRSE